MLPVTTMTIWVHVDQDLPALGCDVLVLTRDGEEVIGFRGRHDEWWMSETLGRLLDVVAWKPCRQAHGEPQEAEKELA